LPPHSGQSAVFYGVDPIEEPGIKRSIADLIGAQIGIKCHPLQLIICGSAHLGFSPVPEKFGKPFDSRKSDVDIAVVSAEIFDRWWTELQKCDSLTGSIPGDIALNLFRGYIDPSKVVQLSATGRIWWELFGGIQIDRARGVRGRVYRTLWNMQSYHTNAIRRGREKLKGIRGT
jgi:hypothetical protein